ncbi:uncharacterized protein [Nicotiana tomentosiformis]|uniref:uncharacterized protein n=1 Tax=Nicotiana tomentosiformis TaxID=4098 RepID=UPI00388C6581
MVLEDARVLSALVGAARYLRFLVTEEDQAKMNEVGASSLFNEAQQALNRSFLRYRLEISQIEFELKEQVQKKDIYRLLSEQKDGAVKDLQDELDQAQKEASTLKREHVDRVEKSSVIAEQDTLGREYEAIKSKLETTSADAEVMVAQYKADVEAVETHLKTKAEYVKRLSQRETLEEIHARGFDMSAEIKEAKKLEAEAKELYQPEGVEGSEGSDSSGDESDPSEDQA